MLYILYNYINDNLLFLKNICIVHYLINKWIPRIYYICFIQMILFLLFDFFFY